MATPFLNLVLLLVIAIAIAMMLRLRHLVKYLSFNYLDIFTNGKTRAFNYAGGR
ncbi:MULTISPECIES: hypothetical protein [Pseudanabaena]|uniref:hypothetical protein n=1 Tax=Pseudanabaena TaxID=1152 RepID=UPI00247A2FC2|nr:MULTISPECIES: hypothetical protein [Pseudanabaena]MEA5486679.1 hypothetical protein [Pseudanabaena sp. CCNP1317]WGS70342.1 hypothetical protein OA858_11415 [Pseudanabaena galeata CCNP1313]